MTHDLIYLWPCSSILSACYIYSLSFSLSLSLSPVSLDGVGGEGENIYIFCSTLLSTMAPYAYHSIFSISPRFSILYVFLQFFICQMLEALEVERRTFQEKSATLQRQLRDLHSDMQGLQVRSTVWMLSKHG